MPTRVFTSLLALAAALLLLPGTARATIFLANQYAAEGFRVSSYSDEGTLLNANFVTGMSQYTIGLAVAGDHLYVANRTNSSIGRYSIDGSTADATWSGTVPFIMNNLTASADSVFVSTAFKVGQYGFDGVAVGSFDTASNPISIAVAGNHLLFANNSNSIKTIERYNLLTSALESSYPILVGATISSLAVAGDSLFIASYTGTVGQLDYTVGQYNLDGSVVNSALMRFNAADPTRMTVAGDRLFLVKMGVGGGVAEYNTSGQLVNANFISGNGFTAFATDYVGSAVPEPGRALLLLIGGASLFLRRRRPLD